MVMSGKGGVGKTTVAVNLAIGLALYGRSVGLLDADITGPNIPKMLGIEDQGLLVDGDLIQPFIFPAGPDGIEVVSMAFLADRSEAIALKGPVKMSLLRQFVHNISWGGPDGVLDYMIVDLAPGTGDEPVSIAELLKPDGAIIVAIPHSLSIMDALRAVDLLRKMNVPVLGLVENMSGFICPHCGSAIDIFSPQSAIYAAEMAGVPVLGRIPLDPAIPESCDSGRPYIIKAGSSASCTLEKIAATVIEQCEGK